MCKKLEGFKNFYIESEAPLVSIDSGLAELSRLNHGHFFFTIQTDHKLANYFMNGHLMKASFLNSKLSELSEIEKSIRNLNHSNDSLLIIVFPKRWQKKLGKATKEQFGQMIGEFGKSAQYVLGMFCLWNNRMEEYDSGHFIRNSNYHANDELLNKWLEKHPSNIKEKAAIPLDRQPRIMGYHLLDQGKFAFHGHNET